MKIVRFEIVDNRDMKSFDCGKWWGIVWMENGHDACMSFDYKKDAVWFVNGGYEEFVILDKDFYTI